MRVKTSKQPPAAPNTSAEGPCPTSIQIVGRLGTGSLPREAINTQPCLSYKYPALFELITEERGNKYPALFELITEERGNKYPALFELITEERGNKYSALFELVTEEIGNK